MRDVPKSVAALRDAVDFSIEIFNGGDGEDVEIVTEGMTWEG